MSDYYPKSARLPKYLYRRTRDTIRGYDAMKAELEELAYMDAHPGGVPSGGSTSDPTAAAAEKRERLAREIVAIDKAVESVRPDYREVAFISLKDDTPLYKIPGGTNAHQDTWTKYRQQIIYYTAINLGWWEE